MGEYLEITNIDAPVEAEAGTTVSVVVEITNVSAINVARAQATLLVGGIAYPTTGDQALYSGSKGYWVFSVIMPDHDITLWVYANFYGTDDTWYTDDIQDETVSLVGGEPPGEISAQIESLKVYSTGIAPRSPPLTGVEPGSRLSIKFDAHSAYGSFPSGLYFDATVILDKPESGNQSRYDKSETGPYSKCTLDHFDFSNDWVADEKGAYYATIILRARTSLLQESIEVDRISSVKVFTVTEDPTPPGSDYDGEIRNPNIRKCNSSWQPLTGEAVEIPAGNALEVKFDGRNLCGCYAAMHGWATVKDPSGVTVFSDYDDYTTIRADGTDHHFKFPRIGCSAQDVTALGQYTVEIVLKAEHDGVEQEVDRQSYTLSVVEGEEPDGGSSEMNGYIEQVYVDWTNLAGGELPAPVAGAPLGENFRVSFHGTIVETVLHTQTTRGYVWLYGPDGSVKYEDSDNVLPTGYIWAPSAGAWYHPFVFPSVPNAWPLDEKGEWTYKVRFEDSQGRAIDEKEGVLFASVEGEEPDGGSEEPPDGEASGKAEIVHFALDYKLIGSGDPIPVEAPVTTPDHARLSVIAKTVSSERERLAAEVWIYGPAPTLGDGQALQVERGPQEYHYYDVSSWPCCDPQAQHEFLFPSPTGTFLLDSAGQWDIIVNITDATDEELLAKYDGVLCNGQEEQEGMWGTIAEMMPLMMIMMMFAMIVPMMKDIVPQGSEKTRVTTVPPERRLPPGRE